jgi:hypothetical protein
VIAAELTTDSPDFGHLEPMVRAAQRELRAVELGDPGLVLADAGYWHQRQIETVVSDGIQVLVAPDQAGAAAHAQDGPAASMTSCDARSRHPNGRALYRQRQTTIEPVFGQLKFNRQIRRFQGRDERPAGPNGGSSPAPTTSSSSTTTAPPPSPPRTAAPPPRAPAGGPVPSAQGAAPRRLSRQPHAKAVAQPHPSRSAVLTRSAFLV